jgi:hypothetical protein
MSRNTLCFLLAVVGAALSTLTQPLADDNRTVGRQVAMEICSHCHQVTYEQIAPPSERPELY